MYGVIFIFLGNTAGNAIIFGKYFLLIVNPNPRDAATNHYKWTEKGIAIAVITCACLLHSFWRRSGVYVINGLACVRLAGLWAMIIMAFAARGGAKSFAGLPKNADGTPPWSSLDTHHSFRTVGTSEFSPNGDLLTTQAAGTDTGAVYGWAVAVLSVLFS